MNEEKKRDRMVELQLAARGIVDSRVLGAIRKVPREEFFSKDCRELAYCDGAFSIGRGQTISQPFMVAKMTECLELKGAEKVLEIGTGSGYQAAILAELAKKVYTVERIEVLSERARNILKELGYSNIEFRVGDGTYGWEEFAPYDRIIVTAGARDVPLELIEQLSKEKGILVIPVGASYTKILKVIIKDDHKLLQKEDCACYFVPLVGDYE
jgi:protein-L-isoaspartate(D-aspartate) O-methyltransferase